MKRRSSCPYVVCVTLLVTDLLLFAASSKASDPHRGQTGSANPQPSPATSWYFTVSGDSRDCGDLIMPKIANSIRKLSPKTPAAFYWHLGDLRNLISPDCDMLIPLTGSCSKYPPAWGPSPIDFYLTNAWDEFIDKQIKPFGELPFFLGIGNHELYANHTRRDFRLKFQKWLTQPTLYFQQAIDAKKGIRAPDLGMSYYHFVMNGVDFIHLDNADINNPATQFDGTQINWFSSVLAADLADPTIKTIIVGMHAALPYSTLSGHAMDASCQGLCSGQRVYDLLYQASTGSNKKNVYVLASHSHTFEQDVFNTPQHRGQVLPGWIVGTAGASQYLSGKLAPGGAGEVADCWKTKICYGYLLVEVRPDGTINPQFQHVTQDTQPVGNPTLSNYCFTQNGSTVTNTPPSFNCACGAAK